MGAGISRWHIGCGPTDPEKQRRWVQTLYDDGAGPERLSPRDGRMVSHRRIDGESVWHSLALLNAVDQNTE